MSWKKVTLGEVSANIQTGPFGSQLHQYDYSETGTPVVMPKDLIGGKISEQSIARVSEDHVQRLNRHIIQKDDILYSRRGDVGRCAFATEHEKGWLCGTGCLRVTTNISRADSKFIFYQLQQPEVVGWVEKHAVGSTMLNLNTAILSNIPLVLPSMNIQHQIADILSAYDDLIENNRKQIKLLEEAAQRLYKEWFVDLRFPGHEHTKIVDGVPEGWGKLHISDVCDTIGGGTPSTKVKEYYQNGSIPWVTPTDITKNNSLVLLDTATKITNEGLSNSSAKMVPPGTILMTSRASVGFFGICNFPVCTNQGFISCVPYQHDAQMYLLYNLLNRVDEIRAKAGGSTYLEISKKTFRDFEIVVPDTQVLTLFQITAEKSIEQIRILSTQILKLQQARDRLLPKLMSGEVEV